MCPPTKIKSRKTGSRKIASCSWLNILGVKNKLKNRADNLCGYLPYFLLPLDPLQELCQFLLVDRPVNRLYLVSLSPQGSEFAKRQARTLKLVIDNGTNGIVVSA